MVDSETIGGALASIKTSFEIAKSLMGMRDANMIQTKVAELLGQIAAAQEGALRSQERESALARQIHKLEQCIAEMEDWKAEKERYKLQDFGGHTFAYVLKPSVQSEEPDHRLCAACFENKHRSTLQFKYESSNQQGVYFCPACKTEFMFGTPNPRPYQRRAITSSWMTR